MDSEVAAVNNRATLLDLADRCEKATGPDRELDAAIACVHRGLKPVLLVAQDERYGDICDPADSGFGTANRVTAGLCYARFPEHLNPPTLGGGRRGNIVQGFKPAAYTASFDAAMGLVDEQWQSAVMWDRDERTAVACVGPNALAGFVLGKGEAKGLNALDTKARALTAAALRARASMENPA